MEKLKSFYKSVKPWGFWKPVFEEIKKTDKNFTKNKNFGRDMFNVFVGIIWQMSLVVWPMYLLIKKWDGFMISIAVVIITTLLLKKFWYDNLKKRRELLNE